MAIKPIRTQDDHRRAVVRIEKLLAAKPGTPEFDELDVLATLVDAYEREHHAIEPPSPIEAIRFRMEQGQFTRADLVELLGSSAKATEVLNKKRSLSKAMITKTPFFVIFQTTAGEPKVGAFEGGEDDNKVLYSAPDGDGPEQTPYTAHVRVELTGVAGG